MKLRERISYANVVATLALFLAIGGVGYAATKLPKNSVGTKQIKKNAVTGAKVKKHTLTGKNINLNKLGTVPSASSAGSAAVASSLTALEAVHVVGAPGQPTFLDGTLNRPGEEGVNFPPAGFYKDHEGIVHLQGFVKVGSGEGPIIGLVFTLPVGFRPGAGLSLVFPNVEENEEVSVLGSNVTVGGKDLSGDIFANAGPGAIVSLNGITFRAEG
jgi:hypothetical protein